MYYTKNISKDIESYITYATITKNLSSKSIKAYKSDLRIFNNWINKNKIKIIVNDNFAKYFQYLKETKMLKANTIQRKYIVIRAFMNYCSNNKWTNNNLKFITGKQLPKTITSNELNKLFTALDNSLKNSKNYSNKIAIRDNALIELLFSLGLRISEISNITLKDLDIDNRSILIRGKRNKQRVLYIASDVVLLKIREWIKIRSLFMPTCDNLFLNKYGNSISIYGIGNIFNKYKKLAGINPSATPHYLRHTFATKLLENGADIRSVQEILGHANIATTEIYTHVSIRRKKDVLTNYNPRKSIAI